jgi:uncharacterized protein (DUF433 family)
LIFEFRFAVSAADWEFEGGLGTSLHKIVRMNDALENLVEVNPEIMMGKPVIKGTRITVEGILARMAAGETDEAILRALPSLTPVHLRAALACASKSMGADHVYPPAG